MGRPKPNKGHSNRFIIENSPEIRIDKHEEALTINI
jgi:hypothetical protein